MKPKKVKSDSFTRAAWAVVFYCSGACFLGSVVVAGCLPQIVSRIELIYLLSLASGIVFWLAAIRRRRLTNELSEATGDAVWITQATHTDAADGLDIGDN